MMKKAFILSLALVLIGCGVGDGGTSKTPKVELDKPMPMKEKKRKPGFTQLEMESGSVQWIARGVGKRHTGTIDVKTAYLDVAAELAEAEFILDMSTIKSDAKGLDAHLRGDDFFSVDKYPTARLFINKVVPRKPGIYQLTGYLTIKDTKKSISFPATVFQNPEGKLIANAKFSIDRTQWGIRYGSGKFFEDLGDKLIKDLVEFEVDVIFKDSFPEEKQEAMVDVPQQG